MALTEEQKKRLAELQKKYDKFYQEALDEGMTEEEAKVEAMLRMGADAEEYQDLYEESVKEKEEEEEEEEETPKRVKINELVDVYDEKSSRWYTAKWSIFQAGEDIEYASISISAAGTYLIVAGIQGRRIIITSISFTVDGECFITLASSYGNISGAMPFGGEGQPFGMAAGTGAYFIPLQEGAGFSITVSEDVNVGGFVTFVRR
jgi:hypothetical protein